MSEIPTNGPEITDPVELLVAKEEWIQETAQRILDTRTWGNMYLSPDLVTDGVRVASLWLDAFKESIGSDLPESDEDIRLKMKITKLSALEQSDTNHRYPNDMPSMQLNIAANDAFCLGFGDQLEEASRFLDWPMDAYGYPLSTS